jgi:hypothetical protein
MLWPLAGPVSDPAQLAAYSGAIGYEIDLAQAEHVLAEIEPEPQATVLTPAALQRLQ